MTKKHGVFKEENYAAFEKKVVSYIKAGSANADFNLLAAELGLLDSEQKKRLEQTINDELPQSHMAYTGSLSNALRWSGLVVMLVAIAEYLRTNNYRHACHVGFAFGAVTFFAYSHYANGQVRKDIQARERRAFCFLNNI